MLNIDLLCVKKMRTSVFLNNSNLLFFICDLSTKTLKNYLWKWERFRFIYIYLSIYNWEKKFYVLFTLWVHIYSVVGLRAFWLRTSFHSTRTKGREFNTDTVSKTLQKFAMMLLGYWPSFSYVSFGKSINWR